MPQEQNTRLPSGALQKIVPQMLHLHHHRDEQSAIFLEGAHLFHIILCFCMLKVFNAEISIAHIGEVLACPHVEACPHTLL